MLFKAYTERSPEILKGITTNFPSKCEKILNINIYIPHYVSRDLSNNKYSINHSFVNSMVEIKKQQSWLFCLQSRIPLQYKLYPNAIEFLIPLKWIAQLLSGARK